jgi:hypothetical protein
LRRLDFPRELPGVRSLKIPGQAPMLLTEEHEISCVRLNLRDDDPQLIAIRNMPAVQHRSTSASECEHAKEPLLPSSLSSASLVHASCSECAHTSTNALVSSMDPRAYGARLANLQAMSLPRYSPLTNFYGHGINARRQEGHKSKRHHRRDEIPSSLLLSLRESAGLK